MATLEISKHEVTGGVCLNLVGTIDSHTVKKFEDALNDLRGSQKFKIILDLSKVSYMSSAGLGALLDLLPSVKQNSGKLVLLGAVKPVQEVFEVLGIINLFTFVNDMPAALKAMGG